MNYDLIQNFITIAKTRNITRTAEILFVAQSTVSHRLHQLEEILGSQLVFRNKGKHLATLTEYGNAFLPIAEKWMALWGETNSLIISSLEAKLVVGCVNSLVLCLLKDFFTSFISDYPNIHLQIKALESDDIYNKLKAREIDIGISLANLPYQNVNIRPLLSERMFCVCTKGLLSEKSVVGPEDLALYDEILLNWGIEYSLWRNYWFRETPVPRLQVNTIMLIEEMLLRREAWAIVPETVSEYFVKHESCDQHILKNPPPNRISYLITPALPDPNKAEIVRSFESKLYEFISEYRP